MAMGEEDGPRLQKAKAFFTYGNDAALKSNHDYAIEMYKEACKLAPDNLVYRQALRGIARRKSNDDPTS
jgi:tetratricopeptide (TPR) repeat protein